MNLKRLFFSLVITLVIASSAFAANTIPEQIISDAKAMLKEISEQEDSSGMEDTLRGSYAVAIVPSMVKAGLLIGGTYGEGFILKRENGKWYGPSFYNIGGASFGLQVGAQEVALLMAV
ncbi:MAG: lipid-binding SYLF domain-containing protein, partial [Synergistaceae bacterium]|nr:lipid-binding SYLF domain-containing protein [Synergistaceae bacterium]